MARRGGGSDLSSALSRLVGRLDRSSGGGWRNVRAGEAWTEVAGTQIAAHTGRVFLRGTELVVSVDSPIWAGELSAMSEMLRARINEALGKEEVRTLRFAVSRQAPAERSQADPGRAQGHAGADRVPPVALSEAEIRRVRDSVSGIENDALREAAFRATVRHLEWSKGIEAAKRA